MLDGWVLERARGAVVAVESPVVVEVFIVAVVSFVQHAGINIEFSAKRTSTSDQIGLYQWHGLGRKAPASRHT